MRSTVPLPGNPWPHDMLITVEDDPQPLVDLLWIREAWNLNPTADELPPLLSDTPARTHDHAVRANTIAWQDAWPTLWAACVQHAGQILDSGLVEQIPGTANGSAERAELLHRITGPSWRDMFGDDAFTAHYENWSRAAIDARSRRRPQTLEEVPERVSLASLIPAWQAGLQKIVVIPCRGANTRSIGQHALLVTAETRDDPHRYSEALTQFHSH